MIPNKSVQQKTPPILEVENLHIYYDGAHVIQGATVILEQGALAVVGRNGMGKTTLCNAIMGMLPVRSGSIRLAGRQIRGLSPHKIAKLGVGYVPQGRRLWSSLSVDEHLAVVPRHRGHWNTSAIYQLFPRLAERRNHRGKQLSGGEQQMLAIARALLSNPRLLIMDEPSEGLAPAIVRQIEKIIADLVAKDNMSVLIVEQNIGVAARVSGMTAVMVGGRINCTVSSAEFAADRQLQQYLLGVSRQNSIHGNCPEQTI